MKVCGVISKDKVTNIIRIKVKSIRRSSSVENDLSQTRGFELSLGEREGKEERERGRVREREGERSVRRRKRMEERGGE